MYLQLGFDIFISFARKTKKWHHEVPERFAGKACKYVRLLHPRGAIFNIGTPDKLTQRGNMPKVIQNNNTNRSNPDSSSSGPKSFNFVLRRGLKKTKEFLDLFPFLRILFPRRSSTFSDDNSFRNSISRGKHFRLAALFSGFGLVFLFTLTFSPLQSPVSPTEAATGTAQDSTLTLDVTSASAVVDINVVDSAGTFSSSDKTTSDKNSNIAFSITTNNFSGYTLSIAGADDTGLMNDEEAENSLSSIPTMLTEDAFSNAANTMYNGMWGYKPSKYNSAVNTNYYPAPTTEESTLDVTAVPNTTANNYTIALGARTDFTKPSTTYKSSNFIITAVTNPINYSIAYNSNTTDTVNNMPGTQSASTSATSITLSNNTPTREHYTFNGWCSVKPTTTNGDDVCNGGTVYLSGAVYGIDKTTLNDTTLYAMWNIDKFVQTTQVRYENADGTWGSYTTVDTKTVNYGSSYSWSTSQITDFNSTAYKAGSVSSYTVTADKTNQVSIYRNTFTCKIQSRFQNADGTYGSYTTRVNETRRYGQTCSWSTANISNFDSTTYKAASYTNNNITANVNQSINIDRNTFACTARYRLQNADGTYPTTYTSAGTVNSAALYGSTCSYTTNQNTTQYQNKTASATVTKATTLSVDVPRATYACTARYKLQNADGTYPSAFTTVSINSAALYGSTCSYTTAQDTTKYTNQSASATVTGATTLTVGTSGQVPRKTYKLTVTAGTNTSNATGAGTYRWGQTVAVGVTKATNTTCVSYATPTWTKTAGTLSSTSGTSVNFTMPTSAATVTATSTATNNKQTITLSRSNATGIKIAGTNYTGTSVKLTCGTYALEGVFASGYEFSKWAITGTDNSLTSTTAAKPTLTVGGAGTLTLTGKTSQVLIQNVTSANCSGTVYDNRGGVSKAYTVAKIGSLCWMTKNLDLPGGTTLTSADSNVSSNYTLPASSTSGFSSNTTAYVYNSNSTTCSSSSPCYSYYSYVAATAGTNPSSGAATADICPKGWRLPTQAEMQTMANSYTTGATMTASPFLGVYAGHYYSSSFGNGGSNGYYWSSTAYSSTYAYRLYFYSSGSTVSYDYKRLGFSVRCVAKS